MPNATRPMPQLAALALALVLVPALIMAGGCGSKEAAPVDPEAVRSALVGKKWTVGSLSGRSVVGKEPLTIEFFPDGSVSGGAGCGTFSGSYVLEGSVLHIDDLTHDGTSCGPALDEQAFSYLSFLRRVSGVRLAGSDVDLTMEESLRPVRLTTGSSGWLW
ncbi:META domain-containing protein [Pseudodesulfovibrio sp. F-1]|uniref:META domain-containing protein n=1 Tax=Pseudodesulfovibrio alkaliphilus TaxID=2661613 RepID=A0A7K1KKA5_9BACT|nr:META domain-containing protein [Pseudodesulfovibrio alkaliphilus]MUM76421.1 META domain-containing protein [Pseudodesulfovibrio alkaliphilus]